jgi:hypothetical protein
MSTNSNCEFIQVKTDKWFYVLEDYNAPKNAWDWREYAVAYGPFGTEDKAHDHLDNNHANPGGWNVKSLPEGVSELDISKDEILTRLIAEARSPVRHQSPYPRFRL